MKIILFPEHKRMKYIYTGKRMGVTKADTYKSRRNLGETSVCNAVVITG